MYKHVFACVLIFCVYSVHKCFQYMWKYISPGHTIPVA